MNYDYMILQNHTIPVNENDGLPLSKCYWAILATALGVGISVIDVTIANVALPTIACDLGTSPSATIWIVNAYQIAITILSSLSLHWETFTVTGGFTYQAFCYSASPQGSVLVPTRFGCWQPPVFYKDSERPQSLAWIRRYSRSSIPNVFLVAEWASMPLSLPYRLLPDRQSLRLFSLWVHGIVFCHQHPNRNCRTRNRTDIPAWQSGKINRTPFRQVQLSDECSHLWFTYILIRGYYP